jgi:hypothetical protein
MGAAAHRSDTKAAIVTAGVCTDLRGQNTGHPRDTIHGKNAATFACIFYDWNISAVTLVRIAPTICGTAVHRPAAERFVACRLKKLLSIFAGGFVTGSSPAAGSSFNGDRIASLLFIPVRSGRLRSDCVREIAATRYF